VLCWGCFHTIPTSWYGLYRMPAWLVNSFQNWPSAPTDRLLRQQAHPQNWRSRP
jgi:hypothetical protein